MDRAVFANFLGDSISIDFIEKLTCTQLKQALYYLENRVTCSHRV